MFDVSHYSYILTSTSREYETLIISEYTNFILFHFPILKLEKPFNVGFFKFRCNP